MTTELRGSNLVGFHSTRVQRQPIYGERIRGIVGYTERDDHGREWFQDASGKRIARVLRYKPQQAPQAQAGLCGATTIVPKDFDSQ